MLQTLRNRRNRKGFTLAELLIVVAIIAVLVAIAVPLFVGGLEKAKDGTFQANKRSVRAAAVVYVLSDTTIDLSAANVSDTLWFKAKVDHETGEMGEITKVEKGSEELAETKDYKGWTSAQTDPKKDADEIIVHLTVTEIKAAGAGA